jgi:hypothetical protein
MEPDNLRLRDTIRRQVATSHPVLKPDNLRLRDIIRQLGLTNRPAINPGKHRQRECIHRRQVTRRPSIHPGKLRHREVINRRSMERHWHRLREGMRQLSLSLRPKPINRRSMDLESKPSDTSLEIFRI